MNETEAFDEETFESILASSTRIGEEIHESAISNIRKARDKQKKDFDWRRLSDSEFIVGDLTSLHNNKRKDRKGKKLYVLVIITSPKLHPKNLQHLKTRQWDIEGKAQSFTIEIIRWREECW